MSKAIFATAGAGTWTVPDGVTEVTVECLGAGGNGAAGPGGMLVGGTGGAGGQYSIRTGMAVTPGAVLSWQVGVHGGAGAAVGGTPLSPLPCDTWFSATLDIFAAGGGDGGYGGFSTGGSYDASGHPWTSNNGAGTFASPDDTGSSAGGGAGGPGGPGGSGGIPHPFPGSGGGGGGGANGGANGAEANFGIGGAGGNNRLGTGGGTGGTDPTENGGDGTAGGGGGGGRGLNSTTHGNGGNGSQDDKWSDGSGTYGPGSGGGGAGYAGDPGAIANTGGNAGGRGGGGGGCQLGGTPGLGTDGLIVISYRGSGSVDGRGRLYVRYVRKEAA